jgi:uncharacterized protein
VILYYLDASAWVKRYYAEKGTEWVQDLFSRNELMACATLGVIEVTATLSRKRKAQEINPAQYRQKIEELEDDWGGFVQIQLTRELVSIAGELAKKYALRGSDAVHLASALRLQQRTDEKNVQVIIVTADAELKKASESADLEVVDPEDKELMI